MKFINRISARLFVLILFLEMLLLISNHSEKATNLANVLFLVITFIVISAWVTYDKK